MMSDALLHLKDVLHAQFCYQYLITPLHLRLPKKYKKFAQIACEFVEEQRSEMIQLNNPYHHVLHRFSPQKNANGKKILITHGWMSRAAYMTQLIRTMHLEGYEVYALDFPAHGDAQGIQLLWSDAVAIIKNTMNEHGPFYGVIGHSFGGSMLLNTINLAGQLPDWRLYHYPEKVILIASPVRMTAPIKECAKRLKLSSTALIQLRQLFHQQTKIDPKLIRLNRFVSQNANIPFLCIHGTEDKTINPIESVLFCNQYKNANLSLLPDANHISVLIDERVEQLAREFFN